MIWQSNLVVVIINLIINIFMFSGTIVKNIPDFIDNYLLWWIIGFDILIWIIAYRLLKRFGYSQKTGVMA